MKLGLLLLFIIMVNTTIGQSDYRDRLKDKGYSTEELKVELTRERSSYKKAVICNEIGLKYQGTGEFESAMVYHRKARVFSKRSGKGEEEAISLNKIGIIHYYGGNIDSAIHYFKASVPLYEDPLLKANSINNLGLMYKLNGNPDSAIKQYLRSLTIFKNLKNYSKWAVVLNNISALHWQRENKTKSKEYAREAIAIAKEHDIESELISGKINLANVLKEQDSVRTAMKLYNDVIRWSANNGDLSTLANAKNNLAICYGILGEAREELATYREVLELYVQSGNDQYLSAVWLNMASTFEKMGNLDSTLAYAKSAEKNARQFNKTEYLEPIFEQLSSVYKGLSMFDSSIYYKDAILSLRDSLNAESEELVMHELEEKYKNKELKGDLKDSNEASEKAASSLKKVLITLGVVLFLLLIALVAVRIWRKRSKKLRTVVVEKEVQLESLHEEVSIKDQEIEELQFVKEKNKLPYPANLTPLTSREKEVLEKVSEGLKDQEVADALFVSINTARTHLRKVFVKIDARNRAEAIQFFNEYDLD